MPAAGNVRNGGTAKTLKTDLGPVRIKTPRDRDSGFEPQLVAKRQTRLAGLDERIIDMYAGGMSARDIAEHMSELYGVDVGRDTISRVTAAVRADIMRSVSYRDRKAVARDLRPLYSAPNADAALIELERFEQAWGDQYPMTGRIWRRDWQHITPFLSLPAPLRRIVYTTNTIEAMHRQVRKTIKTRGAFPDEQAASKLIYLAIRRAEPKWRKAYNWTNALAALKIHFEDLIPDQTDKCDNCHKGVPAHTQTRSAPRLLEVEM